MAVELVTLAPGHFHAALVQKQHLQGVASHVHVFGPPGSDLDEHLQRIKRFNMRTETPTRWVTEVYSHDDWLEQFQAARPGNVAIIAGRNRQKIDLILAAVTHGYCVLADKPWIVETQDFAKLKQVFAVADRHGVFAWDIMTERFEATTQLQRLLMNDPAVYGEPQSGTLDQPALSFESVHFLCKDVAGTPLKRPAWWYNPEVAGEGVADVGTHLADLAMWLAFPGAPVDAMRDIEIADATRWPTLIDRDAFCASTGLNDFPVEFAHVRCGAGLEYWGNGRVRFRLRDRFVSLTTKWGVRAENSAGDSHMASAVGSRSTVTVRHDAALGIGPQVVVVPANAKDRAAILAAIVRLCEHRSGYEAVDLGEYIHIVVPAAARTGHEEHFAAVLGEFVEYFYERSRIPAWERANLLAKYRITTEAVRLARRQQP